MRELKFRAWAFDDGIMVDEHYYDDDFVISMDIEGLILLKQTFDQISGRWRGYECCKHEIMQYTGLKDKNGIEIYEGDIVRAFSVFDMAYDYCFDKDNEPETIYQIYFDDGCFQFKNTKQWSDGVNDWRSIENVELFKVEVIGNIYENPELINQ